MTTTTEAELSATDSGSNGISATPRRGRGRSDTLPYVGRIATQGEARQAHGFIRIATLSNPCSGCVCVPPRTTTEAESDGAGSQRGSFESPPKRGGSTCHAVGLRHSCSKRITASARINKHSVQCIGACAVPSNTILLLWRKATSTSINTLYQMQAPRERARKSKLRQRPKLS